MNGKVLNKEALKTWILSKVVTLTNNLLATTPGVSAMDAAQGPVIQGQIDAINSNLKGFEPVLDDSGKITGYKTDLGGADTVFPFNSSEIVMQYINAVPYQGTPDTKTFSYTANKDCTLHIMAGSGGFGVVTSSHTLIKKSGNYAAVYEGNIRLSNGETCSITCSIPTNGGICMVGYVQ